MLAAIPMVPSPKDCQLRGRYHVIVDVDKEVEAVQETQTKGIKLVPIVGSKGT